MDLGSRILFIGGFNNRQGYLDTVEVLCNVDQPVDKWHWGDMHEPSPHKHDIIEEHRSKKELVFCGCGALNPLYEGTPGYFRYSNGKTVVDRETFILERHVVPFVFTTDHNLKQVAKKRADRYSAVTYTKFPPVAYHSATRIGQMVYVFGGENSSTKRNNSLYKINCNGWIPYTLQWETYKESFTIKRQMILWEKLETTGEAPSPRSHHSTCVVDYKYLYVVGGKDGKIKFSDIFKLDSFTLTWMRVDYWGSKLPPMYGHSVASVNNKIFIFGGVSVSKQFLNNIYVLDIVDNQLTQVNVGGVHPSPRAGASLTLVGNELVLCGGHDNEEFKDEFHVLECVDKLEASESTIGKELLAMLDNPKDSDITFEVEGKKIFAHKIILSCRCAHLKKILTNEHPNPILVDNFSYSAFYKLLQYLYSDTITLSSSIVAQVYKLATSYDLKQLMCICESMIKAVLIPPSTFSSDLEWAINNPFCSDVKFIVEGKLVYAHRPIVSLRSTYFDKMLNSTFKEANQTEVKISEIPKETFDLLLQYMYTGKPRSFLTSYSCLFTLIFWKKKRCCEH